MKASIYKVFSLVAIISSVLTSSLVAQVTSSRSGNNTDTPEAAAARAAVRQLLDESGKAFRKGVDAYLKDDRTLAADSFDRSLDTFLGSTMNIQSDSLKNCYLELIQTIYLIEIPDKLSQPNVRQLSLTCGWNLEPSLVENVGMKVRGVNATQLANVGGTAPPVGTDESVRGPQIGFSSQGFEPSPRDDLATFELNEEEKQIDSNPIAQEQFQKIQYAVANKSLGFSFQVHPMIQQFINHYRGRGRTTMEVGLYRSGMFMRMARRVFKEEGIPENVAWLGQVESAWKPVAMSHMAASGLWQFIPGTGDRYGLNRNAYVDERNSLDQATQASARYLKFLYNRYNNWELAIAGYNCGEGNVDKAIRRAGVANFWAAYPYLPKETRDYVPNILATILIANNPNEYGFGHIRPAAPLQYDKVRVPGSTNLNVLAQAADTTVQYLRYLNPHLRSNMTPPTPYVVNIPAGKANEVVALFRRMPAANVGSNSIARSSAGETWQNISNRTGVTVNDLMAANPGMANPKGKVFVPVKGNSVTSTVQSRATNLPVVSAPKVKIVKAVLNDTIATVAQRVNVSPLDLAKENGLNLDSKLYPGRELRVPPASNR